MLWTVTYRDKAGNTEKVEMEAENRAIVIGNLREKGLTVVNILDGGFKDNARKPKSRGERLAETSRGAGAFTWILLVLLLAAGGAVAWWYSSGKPDVIAALKGGSAGELFGGKAPSPGPAQKPHTGKALIRLAD